MRLSFLPGGLLLVKQGSEYLITIGDEEVFKSCDEKKALKKFNDVRRRMEKDYPATELTKEQKQEALKRLIEDQVLRQVRNSTRKSKFDDTNKQGRFDNR